MATIKEKQISQKYNDLNENRAFKAAAEPSGFYYFYSKRLQLPHRIPQVLLGLSPTKANVLQYVEKVTNGYFPYPYKLSGKTFDASAALCKLQRVQYILGFNSCYKTALCTAHDPGEVCTD
ncbi:hypothetical protein T4B_1908 [Trichinella pseudospiralis]|uniref:Uncharacterized protein n=1 Tax=Trichinella pseudospiralis TaxID=6337 RepID=A0A0V1JHA7_TRIPS|nr:hypothetical protein T4B_1908 [Trichinella pseudospiralis]